MRDRMTAIIGLLLAAAASAAAADAVLADPRSLALDRDGNLLVACRGKTPRVVVLARDGREVRSLGAGLLREPEGVAADLVCACRKRSGR